MAETIQQLSDLISGSVADLIRLCSTNNLQVPKMNEPSSPESEAFQENKAITQAGNIIAAAAIQLVASILSPHESVIHAISGYMKSAALRVAIECNVPEILREAGPEGLHADDIAARSGVDGAKLARILRLLANGHIFRETQPDVFANNRISSILDSGKSLDEILLNPEAKHDDTSGLLAMAEHILTINYKSSTYLVENMKDPVTSFSGEPTHAPFQKAFQTDLSFFDWYIQPEHTYVRNRFNTSMRGTTIMLPANLTLELFDWEALPHDSIVVDIGGGIGTSARTILKANPRLQFVIQDISAIVQDGVKYWEKEEPEALVSGRIRFQSHDFFTAQPVEDASVFLLKHILHDWSDSYCIKILTNLRRAAMPDTTLLIFDVIMVPSCRPSDTENSIIAEDPSLQAPEILSTGFNSINEMVWSLDIGMLLLFNSQERTVAQFQELLRQSGWRVAKITRKGSSLDSILAVPI